MSDTFSHFLRYNNAVPLVFGLIFLGATGAFAATEEGRDAVFASAQETVSVDNSRIVNADLANFPLSVQVKSVTEDAGSYYVEYSLSTIELVDGVWQDTTLLKTLTVGKDALGGSDLGLYATKQIAEVRESEKRRLTETQEYERALGVSRKVVATEYSGLVGRFLDPTTETLPGYVPVVVPPPEPAAITISIPVSQTVASDTVSEAFTEQGIVAGVSTEDEAHESPHEPTPSLPVPTSSSTLSGDPSDTVAPTITVLGNNPARIAKGTSYADLGVIVTDDKTLNIGYTTLLDGNPVLNISMDTSMPRISIIMYRTADQAGNAAEATRVVEIYDPYAQ